MLYVTALSLAMRTVTFFNLTYEGLNPGSIIGKWSLILPNAKLLPSHIRTIHPRENVFCGVELEQVDSFPYLGVTISNKLKWSAHVSLTAAKANKSLGTIQRNLWNCPKNVKEIAYTSLVRLKLGYASAASVPVFKERYQCSGKGST